MKWQLLALSLQTLSSLAVGAACTLRAQAQGPAHAATDDAPTSAESPEYKSAIEAALEEYRLQHFTEARSLFARAHALDPSARTLRGLGMVEFELRHYVVADELLEGSLKATTKPLTAAQRSSVNDLLTRTRQFISRYVIAVPASGPEPTVEVDGKLVKLDAEHGFFVESGEHTLRVHAARMVELSLDAKGGDVQTLNVELAPDAAAASAADPSQASGSPAAAPAAHKGHSTLGIVLTSAGAAVLAGSAAVGALALVDAHKVTTRDSSQADHAHALGVATDVMISVGVASAITGVVLLFTERKRRRRVDSTEPRVEAAFPNLRVSF